MERLENEPKIGLNQENKETLKGREGEVFKNIVFKSYKNKKGETTFKSSSKDRKIIILSPFAEVPEAEQPYDVLIIKDSNPDNPMDGKMIATIVTEELGVAEAKDLAIET